MCFSIWSPASELKKLLPALFPTPLSGRAISVIVGLGSEESQAIFAPKDSIFQFIPNSLHLSIQATLHKNKPNNCQPLLIQNSFTNEVKTKSIQYHEDFHSDKRFIRESRAKALLKLAFLCRIRASRKSTSLRLFGTAILVKHSWALTKYCTRKLPLARLS